MSKKHHQTMAQPMYWVLNVPPRVLPSSLHPSSGHYHATTAPIPTHLGAVPSVPIPSASAWLPPTTAEYNSTNLPVHKATKLRKSHGSLRTVKSSRTTMREPTSQPMNPSIQRHCSRSKSSSKLRLNDRNPNLFHDPGPHHRPQEKHPPLPPPMLAAPVSRRHSVPQRGILRTSSDISQTRTARTRTVSHSSSTLISERPSFDDLHLRHRAHSHVLNGFPRAPTPHPLDNGPPIRVLPRTFSERSSGPDDHLHPTNDDKLSVDPYQDEAGSLTMRELRGLVNQRNRCVFAALDLATQHSHFRPISQRMNEAAQPLNLLRHRDGSIEVQRMENGRLRQDFRQYIGLIDKIAADAVRSLPLL
ncbi:hypothetical protein DL96DRAFT_1613103 [Flagelloscypha sp. PMI_526]|nr:hypothetical protein DL96DRAFT_1613103 [Flagelloscypha sp. PMI_526]